MITVVASLDIAHSMSIGIKITILLYLYFHVITMRHFF